MNQLTLFDVISDRILWQCDYCGWCDGGLSLDPKDAADEIVMRVYLGGHDQVCMVGYHKSCLVHHETIWNDAFKV